MGGLSQWEWKGRADDVGRVEQGSAQVRFWEEAASTNAEYKVRAALLRAAPETYSLLQDCLLSILHTQEQQLKHRSFQPQWLLTLRTPNRYIHRSSKSQRMPCSHHLQATAELVNPFTEPEPAHETGPGAHFGSTFAGMPQAKTGSTASASHARSSSNPYRQSPQGKSGVSSTANPVGQSTPPRKTSGSPRFRDSPGRSSPPTKFPEYRDAAPTHRTRRSSEIPPPSYDAVAGSSRPRRTSSLAQRYPGDESHKPLDIIRRDSRKAGKPHHLKKRSMQGPDIIDRLDPAIGGRAYHHEGPYDAASLARNRDPKYAPVAALESTNQEAIRATPQENVKDALEKHMPLDGVAVVPPGQPDRLGRTYDYEEGSDMMREGFNGEPGYKQWAGKVRGLRRTEPMLQH